jgi:carbonic anhydrase/acetyltransferase-like protein (isoleucine patch superfamily)
MKNYKKKLWLWGETRFSHMPTIHKSSFIDPSAVIIGDVSIGKNCGVFPHAVIRGDENNITIGDGSNIQDCCVIHVNDKYRVNIGRNVSVGHSAMIHGATIEDDCLIGIHATILNNVIVGSGSIIGANALITEGTDIPKNSLVIGIPGKIIKQDKNFIETIRKNAQIYQQLSQNHKRGIYSRYHNE